MYVITSITRLTEGGTYARFKSGILPAHFATKKDMEAFRAGLKTLLSTQNIRFIYEEQ